ncbi:unnamed protein product [Brugia timori]|uniref:Methionine--tRNA ligase, mitochondrial n=1 Tax=Brugia timori TaxID=42155 RepID=A0A3P7WVH0_9BILA|nr:unnamed protein product [Brugia timori]
MKFLNTSGDKIDESVAVIERSRSKTKLILIASFYYDFRYLNLMIGRVKILCVIEGISMTSVRLKHFITTPIFYANGPPHIGHLYTALLADVSNRWKLLKGGDVDLNNSLFTTGTDEHGLKIQQTATTAGCDPQRYCDDISDKFKDLFRAFGIQPNDFIRTTETRHKEVVKHVWKELDKRGLIQRGKHEGWYSTVDECFYANDEVEKLDGQTSAVSKSTGSVVEWVQEENYIFPLFKYLGAVRNWLSNCDVIRPKVYFPEALQHASVERDLSLSRDRKRVTWGIAVPNDESQTIYVWFDALVNYLTVSGVFSNKKSSIWPPTCQIVGKDILKFHAVIWPAFLLALDLPLPKRIFVHSHWLVDGVKMSKSIGNVVDPFTASKSLSEEGLRYFLLRQGTPQNDANFTMLKAVNVVNTDLINNVGNLLQRSTIGKLNPSQTYPAFHSDSFRNLLELGEPLIESINCLTEVYEEQFDELMIYKALELLMDVMRQTNGFFQFYEPWKELDVRKVSSLLYICYEVLRICGILLQPVVPHYADHLLNRLIRDKRKRTRIMSNEDHPKKRAKKAPPHECTVILIDVGANMSREGVATTDMQLAKDTVEWIITRKIFTESVDKFTLMLFGSEVTQNPITTDENIFFYVEEMQQAKIDWLRGPSFGKLSKPKDEIISTEESAIELEESKLSNTTQSFKMEPAERILTDILTQTDGVIYSFAEALPVLQRFVPRKVKVRGQKFYLELGIDFKLPLQMYKKIQPANFKLATQKYASITDVQLKRKTVYEKCVKDEKVDDGDGSADSNLSQGSSSKISKEQTIKGYKFGTTIVPYNEEDQKEYGWKPENRCLKLIQFAKRSQILEHYMMDGGACYFIPPALDRSACIAISALVNAMIAEDSVALTRYVYSAASHPRIMGLFPRRSKRGVDMFVGIKLPFYEDFRGLDFPQLNSPTTEPKSDDLKAMHALVEAMDLTKAHFNSETGQFEESLRPRDVPNPKLQNVCNAMKYRALHPNIPLPAFDDKLLGGLLEPNAFLLKRANESLNYLKANFPTIESPSKKQHVKEGKEEILPVIRIDNSVLPESSKFIKTDEMDV